MHQLKSVHLRYNITYNKLSNEMQRKAVHLLLCKFTLHVSGANHTYPQGTQNCNYSLRYWSYFLFSYLPWPLWREVAAQKIRLVLEAVVTVLCIPEDGVFDTRYM